MQYLKQDNTIELYQNLIKKTTKLFKKSYRFIPFLSSLQKQYTWNLNLFVI